MTSTTEGIKKIKPRKDASKVAIIGFDQQSHDALHVKVIGHSDESIQHCHDFSASEENSI